MITDKDLSKIQKMTESVIETKLEQKLEPIRKELKTVNKKLITMDRKINNLQKGQNTILKYVDNQDTSLEKRVNHIETHLHLPTSM